jgi:3' terminal RNA ribose 2'-O-methyltransferase Hen1
LRDLLRDKQFIEIVGVDTSVRALEIAAQRLKLERLAPRQRERIRLLHGALTYRDERLAGYDAAAAVEVIEHLDTNRLGAFERVLFEFARPQTIVLTTPNREYNARFPNLAAGAFRHRDHRFEWTRDEFAAWAKRVASAHGYEVEIRPVGEIDDALGSPSQMGIFRR